MNNIQEINSSITVLNPAKRSMKDQILSDLFTYWEQLRQGREVPARSELDPRAIRSGIHHTFILEMSGPEDFRFRIAGSKVCDLLGLELRSMPARSLIDPIDRASFDEALMSIVERSEVAEIRLESATAKQSGVQGRMLLMPMSDDKGNITRIFGGITVDTPVTHPPLRFEIKDIRTKRIVAGRETEAPSRTVGFAEPEAVFQGKPHESPVKRVATGEIQGSKSQRPYLRLVRDE